MGRKHVLVVPVFLQAHFAGIYRFVLEIAKRGIIVTFVGSERLVALIRSFDDLQGLDFNLISLRDFGIEDLVPSGNIVTDILDDLATQRSRYQPFFDKLVADRNAGIAGPTCIIVDRFYTSVLDAAKELNIPYYQFHSCGATYVRALQAHFSLVADGSLVIKREPSGVAYLEKFEGCLNILGLPPLEYRDILKPPPQLPSNGDRTEFDLEIGRCINEADTVIVNTFYELEAPQIDAMQQTWRDVSPGKIPKLFLVGPLSNAATFKNRSLEASDKERGTVCFQWLDKQAPLSVVYLCIGTIAQFSTHQVEDLSQALEASEQSFLWVASRGTAEAIPSSFEARTREKGLVVRGWVPQLQILQHPAIGGFVTHCGWNSIIESVSSGVPMACWPQATNDQFMNCRHMVDVLKIAVEVRDTTPESPKTHVGLEKAVRLLLSDEGKVLRARVQELKKKAEEAWAAGGSREKALNELVDSIPA
ncbi:unnamed protein product [Calypogeia fissa]